MTFDFAPDWMERAIVATEFTGASPRAVEVSPLVPPQPAAPAHPTMHELVQLVAELFTEGALSWDQVRVLGNQPEFSDLLEQAAPRR